MERRQVLLVDAFADEPTGGRPVAVVPDGGLTERRKQAITSELSTSGVVTYRDGNLWYTDCDGTEAVITAAVAGYAALSNRGLIVPSTHEFEAEPAGISPAGPYMVELTEDGGVSFDAPVHEPAELPVETAALAAAIGVDVATLEDVGADLPAAGTDRFGGTALVPVNFLQHLSAATPDVCALESVLESTDCARLVAFTFDTLEQETDVHARIFDPTAAGNERPASGVGAAACGAQLSRWAAFDGEREEITIECGRFSDRPGRIRTEVSEQPRVSGNALTVSECELLLPPDEDDDGIIEV